MRWIPLLLLLLAPQDPPATSKAAMQKVQLLVGEWRCTGMPKDAEDLKAWGEKAEWNFKISPDDYRLVLAVKDGQFWTSGELSYAVDRKVYRFEAVLKDGSKRVHEGSYAEKDKLLTLEQVPEAWPRHRAVFSLLRDNRFLIDHERQPAKGKEWVTLAQVGCTKEGVPFVKGTGPLCIVTGGAGTIAVAHKGKTYYVC